MLFRLSTNVMSNKFKEQCYSVTKLRFDCDLEDERRHSKPGSPADEAIEHNLLCAKSHVGRALQRLKREVLAV